MTLPFRREKNKTNTNNQKKQPIKSNTTKQTTKKHDIAGETMIKNLRKANTKKGRKLC